MSLDQTKLEEMKNPFVPQTVSYYEAIKEGTTNLFNKGKEGTTMGISKIREAVSTRVTYD